MKYNQSGQSNYEIIYLEKEYFSIRSVKLHEKKKKKKKTLVDPLQKKCPLPGKFSGKQAIPIRERNKV